MSKVAFLGGTCGKNQWRDGLIDRLTQRGVPMEALFDPQLPPFLQWNDETARREDEAKRSATILFFHLGNPMKEQRPSHSLYSLIQVVDSSYHVARTTRAFFDASFLDADTRKALAKITKDIEGRFPGTVKTSWSDFVNEAAIMWRSNRNMLAFMGGTSGNNKWRRRFLDDLHARGVATSRFFDPVVEPGAWNTGVQKLEDQMREACDTEIFFIGNPMEERNRTSQISPYSIVEAYMALYEDSDRAVLCFDYPAWEGQELDAMRKFEQDVRSRFPNAVIAPSISAAEDLLASRLAP